MKLRSIVATSVIAAGIAGAIVITQNNSVSASQSTKSQSAKLSAKDRAELERLRANALRLTAENAAVQQNLKTFDNLDYVVFSGQKWERLKESHAPNVKVVWPDGHVTVGIEQHIQDLKGLFVHAPNTRIKDHPVGFGVGNMTVVEGVFEATFTKPLPDGKGGFIQPTGKSVKIPMSTIGFWKDGLMYEEHLFWDNQAYTKQLGLG
jgi:SnoaL-like polyketide cyclase